MRKKRGLDRAAHQPHQGTFNSIDADNAPGSKTGGDDSASLFQIYDKISHIRLILSYICFPISQHEKKYYAVLNDETTGLRRFENRKKTAPVLTGAKLPWFSLARAFWRPSAG
jgi:hypothetical protein